MLPRKIISALKTLTAKISGIKSDWLIIGSASHAIQGVDVIPNDIDILTDKDGAYAIDRALVSYVSKHVDYVVNDRFKCYYGLFEIGSVKIEVMGEMRSKISNSNLWAPNDNFDCKIYVELLGMSLPLMPLSRELSAYERMGRLDKAAKIREAMERKGLEK